MTKILLLTLLTLLLLASCYQSQNNQELNLATYKCSQAGLRAIGLRNSEGELFIQCRLHKKLRGKDE